MMLSLALLLSTANAFSTTQSSFSRSSVSLNASRNKAKIASRSKWAESRGISGGAAVAESDSATAGLMTNDEGLEYVRLANDNGDTSDVYLFGGVVTSYVTGMCVCVCEIHYTYCIHMYIISLTFEYHTFHLYYSWCTLTCIYNNIKKVVMITLLSDLMQRWTDQSLLVVDCRIAGHSSDPVRFNNMDLLVMSTGQSSP